MASSSSRSDTKSESKKLEQSHLNLSGLPSSVVESASKSFNFSATNSAFNKVDFKLKELEALKSICQTEATREINEEFLNDLKILRTFKLLRSNSIKSDAFEQLSETEQVTVVKFLIKIISHLKTSLRFHMSQFDYLNQYSVANNPIYYLSDILFLIWNWSNRMHRFTVVYCEQKGLAILYAYLTESMFIEELKSFSKGSLASSMICKVLYAAVIGSLHNLSNLYYKFKNEWVGDSSYDFISSLLNVANLTRSIEPLSDIYLSSYLAIANIFDDKDVNVLNDIRQVIKTITELIGQSATQMSKGMFINRIQVKLEENGFKTREIALVDVENSREWHLIELFRGLYHLAVNDSIKYEIYETNLMKDYLRMIVYFGNEYEKEIALKLMWQLCFDKRIADHVSNDAKLCEFIRDLCYDNDESRRKLVQNGMGILWLLRKNTDALLRSTPTTTATKTTVSIQPAMKSKHIMISYNKDNRDLCMRIKAELEKLGYKIWIDIENIHGSSLESMAIAIEESECVLVCMTEKYKQSPNCRAEAEYAFQLKKPLVPLIMQSQYKPDGWLGILLGSKIFVDFTKYKFDECMIRLQRELHPIFDLKVSESDEKKLKSVHVEHDSLAALTPETTRLKKPAAVLQQQQSQPQQNNQTNDILLWTEADVEKWIAEKKFNAFIAESVLPCNGKQLHQMYNMLKNVPEFFYSSLNLHSKLALKDISLFTSELLELFESVTVQQNK